MFNIVTNVLDWIVKTQGTVKEVDLSSRACTKEGKYLSGMRKKGIIFIDYFT